MPTFNYEGFRANGRPIKGSIEAETQADANQMLREQGVFTREVTQGEVKLIYNHPPEQRAKTEQSQEAPKSEAETPEPVDQWRELLCKNLLAVEAAKKELKQYGSMINGSGKTKKEQEASRKRKVKIFDKQIDEACTMALAMAIHESVKMIKDV